MRLIQRQLLKRHALKRTTRTMAWIRRFINKSRVKEEVKRKKGPLSINETEFELIEMIKIYQSKHEGETKFKQTEQQLNFKKNENGIYQCHGRTIGDFPIFISKSRLLAGRLVQKAHYQILHGGVTLTMAKTRAKFWIQHLRQLAKTVIHRSNSCKRFKAIKYFAPVPGQLPTDRTNGY